MAETTLRVVLRAPQNAPGVEVFRRYPQLEAVANTGLKAEELAEIIAPYHGLVVRSATHVTREVVERADSLRVIGRAGVGVDNIDLEAATRRGIVVMNSPLGNSVTTAEHAISMMMALARHIPAANAAVRAGRWERSKFIGIEVCNKTLGVIGLGNIGRIVAERAIGLKMKVIGYDPILTGEAAARIGVEMVTLEQLYRRADFITAHTPLTRDTKSLVGAAAFAMMNPRVRVLTCARGGIAAKIIAEPPVQITVGLGGEAAGLKAEPITAAALKGLLSGFLDQDFNYVSAPFIARERGIGVTESRSRETTDYINTLTLSVRTLSGTHEVAGAVSGNPGPRLIPISGNR